MAPRNDEYCRAYGEALKAYALNPDELAEANLKDDLQSARSNGVVRAAAEDALALLEDSRRGRR